MRGPAGKMPQFRKSKGCGWVEWLPGISSSECSFLDALRCFSRGHFGCAERAVSVILKEEGFCGCARESVLLFEHLVSLFVLQAPLAFSKQTMASKAKAGKGPPSPEHPVP